MLNKLTVVEQKIIGDEEPEDEDPERYLKDFTEYLPSEDSEINYEKYLDSVIPKTRILFELMKKWYQRQNYLYIHLLELSSLS